MSSGAILVTGANGRLGRALLRVGGSDATLIGMASPRSPGAERILDITDASTTSDAVGALMPSAIIHLASVVGPACEADPETAEAVNVDGTANILAAARAHGVERIVFASTSAVYGDSRRHPVSEQDAPATSGAYAATKLRAERLLAAGADAVAIDALRVFNIFGPEMPDSLVTRLESATESAPVNLGGLDTFVRDYIHVDDVARALLASAASSSSGFRVLNVGRGIPVSNRDLLGMLPPGIRDAVTVSEGSPSYSCADITAIGRELGWKPIMPLPFSDQIQAFSDQI